MEAGSGRWVGVGGENSTPKWPVLIFPSALKWQREKLLSPCVCAFPACRQWKYDSEMLARYRQALETAVNLSVKHSLPPLPGRTLLVYLTDAEADKICPKSNPEGVNTFKNGRLMGCWGSREVSCVQTWFSQASMHKQASNWKKWLAFASQCQTLVPRDSS